MVPDGIGGGLVVGGLVLGALARGYHLEPATTGPVDLFADQRRLIAVGQRIHHAGFVGGDAQPRPDERVGLHVDRHQMLARGEAGQGVLHPTTGLPVASTTSTSPRANSSSAESVNTVSSTRAADHPTSKQARWARSTSRSAITVTSSGERGAWARNIEPNLPAPIRPTRTGRPAARRSTASRCRFIARRPTRSGSRRPTPRSARSPDGRSTPPA